MLLLVVAGCSGPGSEYRPSDTPARKLEVRVLSTRPIEDWSPIAYADEQGEFFVSPRIDLTNADVASSGVQRDPHTESYQIVLRLNDAAKAKFLKVTEENIASPAGEPDKRLGFLIDGKVIAAPVVRAPISNGICIISNHFTEEQARQIAKGVVGP